MIAQLSTCLLIFVLSAAVFAQNPPQKPTADSQINSQSDDNQYLPPPASPPALTLPVATPPGATLPGAIPPAATPQINLPNSTNVQSAPISELEKKSLNSFKRDPFRLPKYLIDKLTYKPSPIAVVDQQAIDDRVEPVKRWPAKEYLLVGIIWEVKNPKALIKDLQGRVHVVKLRDRLGNKEGIVTAIKEGAITVTEKKVPLVLRLKK